MVVAQEVDECSYFHYAPTAGERDYVIICADHLRGNCERDSCRYFHAPKHLISRVRDVVVGPAAILNSTHNNSDMDVAHASPSTSYD